MAGKTSRVVTRVKVSGKTWHLPCVLLIYLANRFAVPLSTFFVGMLPSYTSMVFRCTLSCSVPLLHLFCILSLPSFSLVV